MNTKEQNSNEVSDEEIRKIISEEVPILTEEEYYKRDVDESYFEYNSERTCLRAIVRSGIRKALELRSNIITEPIKDEELHDKIYNLVADNMGNLVIAPTVEKIIEVAQKYAASKITSKVKDEELFNAFKNLRMDILTKMDSMPVIISDYPTEKTVNKCLEIVKKYS